MNRTTLATLLGAVLLAACKRGPTPQVSPVFTAEDAWVAPPPVASAASSASAAAAAPSDPFAELPPIPNDARMNVAARKVGFSSDDAYLGYEISTCDPCPSEFHFRGATAATTPIDLAYHWDPAGDGNLTPDAAEKRRKTNDDAVDQKLASLGVGPASGGRALRGPFPYPDLVFATKVVRSSQNGTSALLFGAHLRGEAASAAVYPIRIELGAHPMFAAMPASEKARIASLPLAEQTKARAEWTSMWQLGDPVLGYANVTRNGRELGVVALTSGPMWFEAGATARMDTTRFVAAIYAERGATKLQTGDAAGAIALLEKAAAETPDDAKIAADLARARAPR